MGGLFSLDGTMAIVTGGASGIGAAAARTLAEAGATVAVLDLDRERAAAVADTLPGAPSGSPAASMALACDVADEASVEAAVAQVAERAVPGVLVNCAGIAIRDAATDHPLASWNKVVDVNLTGSFLISRAVARRMIAAGTGGSIVQTASIMGLSGGGVYPNVSYQTTKGALVNMTRALAVEWAGAGIRVNAVAPTYVRTPFIKALLDQPEVMEKIFAMTPLKRLAEPEEVAAAILFLASPAAGMVTGHTLPVDGGFLAQ
ncbi:SDR family NAD(P)-dependent oxidoreductase [Acuticoccus yangtzensis]|uniref:SDR family NAD(P)-dependent oxidoreductase n=1 Tax=Acuticoccus yangtzensis TaxID=1443441 RepID=UPI000949AE0C|nr:SDR family oxidoreductase [Acuticoccus yangtzensis]